MGIEVMTVQDGERLLTMIQELRQEVNSLKKTSVKWLTTEQACKQLECGRDKLDSLRKSGKVEYRMNGKTYRYLASSIDSCYERIEKGKALGKKLADKPYPRLAR